MRGGIDSIAGFATENVALESLASGRNLELQTVAMGHVYAAESLKAEACAELSRVEGAARSRAGRLAASF